MLHPLLSLSIRFLHWFFCNILNTLRYTWYSSHLTTLLLFDSNAEISLDVPINLMDALVIATIHQSSVTFSSVKAAQWCKWNYNVNKHML